MEKQSKITSFHMATVQLPKIVEKTGKDWIGYGGDNLYPEFVIEMMNKSSMNRRCIIAKADATVGKGLSTGDPQTEYTLKFANPTESWTEVLEKVSLDYSLFGGYAINVVWSNDGTQIAEIYHLDFSKIRSGKMNDEGEVKTFWYCYDWKNQQRRYQVKPQEYCSFDPALAQAAAKEGNTWGLNQVLYVKNYEPGQHYYPLPEYVAAMNDIQVDAQVSEFHNSNLSNGLTPSLWIHFNNGDPGPEGRADLYDEISASYSGAENGGRFFLTFSDAQEQAPQITPLQLSNDGYYLALEERITSRILSAHGISSPLLLGLRVGSSGLGSNSQEIETAFQHFLYTVIRPMQKTILKTFNTLMFYRGYSDITLTIVPPAIFNEEGTMIETKNN